MKSIVVPVDAIVNVQRVHVHALRLDHSNAVIRAVEEIEIANRESFALIREHVVRPLVAADAAWRLLSAHGRVKLIALTVNRPGAFDGHILRMHGKQQSPVAVDERGVAMQRNRIDGVILLAVRASEQRRTRSDMHRHIALQFCRADLEDARGHEHRAAAVARARIDRRLQRRGVQCLSIALRTEVANVVDASA